FGTFEAMYMSIADVYPGLLLKRAWASKLFVCIVSLFIGLPMMTQGGYYLYTLVDWYQGAFVMVIAFIQVLGMAYAYGSRRIRANIFLMTGVRMTIFWDIVWRIFLPILLMALFAFTIMDYRSPNYGEYEYPKLAVACGWLFAACGLVPLPVLM
uniref:Sodium-dependent transporter n=1 Tax=Macrostomum lignano TaxID=282301 RepID=A0A1I8I2F5_9PLAT